MRERKLPEAHVEVAEAGPRERGSAVATDLRCEFDAPGVRIETTARCTHGGRVADTAPCGKCGCEFVNVGCPKIWPIGTVVLTCSMCGSVVDYVDGLLIMTVQEAIENQHGRDWVIRHRLAVELGEKMNGELLAMALEKGFTVEQIAEIYDIEVGDGLQ